MYEVLANRYKITNNDPMLSRRLDKPGEMLSRHPLKHNPMLSRQLKVIAAKSVTARLKKTTPEQRKEIASKAANARWAKGENNGDS
jgi:hypothetical protein